MTRIAGDNEFPPESQERADAALACAGTTASVDSFIDGYGDYDGENDGTGSSVEDIDAEYLDGVLVGDEGVIDDVINDNWEN